MNVNLYIEDSLSSELDQYIKATKKSRNAIIREAVREWLAKHASQQWPSSVSKYKGIQTMPVFESYRSDLISPKEDPFA